MDDWDRAASPDSDGTILFSAGVAALPPDAFDLGPGEFATPLGVIFATPADPAAPLTTPDGLADPEAAGAALVAAAKQVGSTVGRLDVPSVLWRARRNPSARSG